MCCTKGVMDDTACTAAAASCSPSAGCGCCTSFSNAQTHLNGNTNSIIQYCSQQWMRQISEIAAKMQLTLHRQSKNMWWVATDRHAHQHDSQNTWQVKARCSTAAQASVSRSYFYAGHEAIESTWHFTTVAACDYSAGQACTLPLLLCRP